MKRLGEAMSESGAGARRKSACALSTPGGPAGCDLAPMSGAALANRAFGEAYRISFIRNRAWLRPKIGR